MQYFFVLLVQDWIIYIIFYYIRDTSVSWDDIGIIIMYNVLIWYLFYQCTKVGLENVKRLLEDIVILPEERPDVSVMLNRYSIIIKHTLWIFYHY